MVIKLLCIVATKILIKNLFFSDLCSIDFSGVYQHTDPNNALQAWYSAFIPVVEKHAPCKTRRVKLEGKPQWLNEEINQEIKNRDKMLQLNGNNQDFKKQRNAVAAMKRAARKKYFSELISSKQDTKSIWKAINQLSGKRNKSLNKPSADLSAEELNVHFSEIADKIVHYNCSHLNELEKLKHFCRSKNITMTMNFDLISVHEVYLELCSLNQSKSRGLDMLDNKILKHSAPIIAEHLTYIYNLCIDKCCYPQSFKDAKVLPLFKSGDPNDPSNYRPISILSCLSKPLERHLKKNIQSHLKNYDLLHTNQSGFRENHSCQTALTNLIEQWHLNINNNLFTGAIFVDFAKAFDTIDNGLLLKKALLVWFIR